MFEEQIGKSMEVYIDDMLVKSLRIEDHLKHLQESFSILKKYNMNLNPEKCACGVGSDKFLGFMCPIGESRSISVRSKQLKLLQ